MDSLWFILCVGGLIYWTYYTVLYESKKQGVLVVVAGLMAGISALGVLLAAERILK